MHAATMTWNLEEEWRAKGRARTEPEEWKTISLFSPILKAEYFHKWRQIGSRTRHAKKGLHLAPWAPHRRENVEILFPFWMDS
jgi:hypothetical protein